MACLNPHHKELDSNGVGKCSVPMWMHGCPAGFCDEPAYGPQTKQYKDSFRYMDSRYYRPVYCSGLACQAHGGPTNEQAQSGKATP